MNIEVLNKKLQTVNLKLEKNKKERDNLISKKNELQSQIDEIQKEEIYKMVNEAGVDFETIKLIIADICSTENEKKSNEEN